jgi:hypothetical protein
LPELAARATCTLLFVSLVWSFALNAMWPPSRLWVPILLLIPASGWAAGWLWLRYFEEQSVQRERRERSARLDKPTGPPRIVQAEEERRPETVEPRAWPPPPDQQQF